MAQEFEPEGPRPDPPLDDDAATFFDEASPAAPQPVAAVPTPRPLPAQPTAPPARSPFPLVMSVLMAGTLIGAWIFSKQGEPAASATTPPAAADAKPAEPVAAPTPAEDVKVVRGEVEALTKRIDGLQSRIDGLPKPEPAPDIKPIQKKVEELAKVPEMVAPLPRKLDDLDGRIGSLSKHLDALKADVAALKKPPRCTAPESTTPAAAPEDVDGADQAMAQAVDLFKGRKYKEAADAFRKLSEDKGNDARVWYFAALSNGLATQQWRGETETFVKKGVEREKAGSPPSDKIDQVLNDVPPTIKPWLAGWRKRAK